MAKVLVAYGSRLGSTKGIAEAIGAGLEAGGHEAAVQSVEDQVEIGSFDAVVLGSGVYVGRWHRPAMAFARLHAVQLAARPVWLFSSGPVGEMKEEQTFPDPLDLAELRGLIRPRGHRLFWGALDRSAVQGSDLGILEGLAARLMVPAGDWRDWPTIRRWATEIARELSPDRSRRPGLVATKSSGDYSSRTGGQ